MKKITVAVVSYNEIPPYKNGCEVISIDGKDILILSKTFNPKSPASVLPTDPNWARLMAHKDELEQVIIFAGKKESGALEIIDLAVRSFQEKKEVLSFLLCDHDLGEKVELLEKLGISDKRYPCFSNGYGQLRFSKDNERCRETPSLKGLMYDFLDKLRFSY